jgi:hypothetical protein
MCNGCGSVASLGAQRSFADANVYVPHSHNPAAAAAILFSRETFMP